MTSPRILVVDDEADIRGLISEILVEEGYEVEVAADAASARRADAARSRSPRNPSVGRTSARDTLRRAIRDPRLIVAVPSGSPDRERTHAHCPGESPAGTSRRSSPNTHGWPERSRSSPFRLTRTSGKQVDDPEKVSVISREEGGGARRADRIATA